MVGRLSMSMQSLTASRGPSPGASRRTIQTGSKGPILANLRSHGRFAWMSRRLRCRDRLVPDRVTMRVAIITESFPPTSTALRTASCASPNSSLTTAITPWSSPPAAKGHERRGSLVPVPHGARARGPFARLPGLPARAPRPAGPCRGHRARAELVHLASPVVLGAHGAAVARRLGVPAVMVSHESVAALLKLTRLGPARAVADWLNRRTARA
jgi:hypothetical protein